MKKLYRVELFIELEDGPVAPQFVIDEKTKDLKVFDGEELVYWYDTGFKQQDDSKGMESKDMSEQEKSWSERFDDKFGRLYEPKNFPDSFCDEYKAEIKSFFREVIADEREKAIAEYQLKLTGK